MQQVLSSHSKKLSVIIPVYNEAARIIDGLNHIADYVQRCGRDIEVIVVDDGSQDQTVAMAKSFELSHGAVHVVEHDEHHGKGFGVRAGMLRATGDHLLMSDIDFSTPLSEVEQLERHLEDGADIAIGSRDCAESVLEPAYGWRRWFFHHLFCFVRRCLMLPKLYDTQCGFKCFKRSVAHRLFEQQQIEGFVFDCEILALADRAGDRIDEVGVLWRNDTRSKVQLLKQVWPIWRDLFWIRRHICRR